MWLDGALALMVTEPFRAWLFEAPLVLEAPVTTAGAAGTAGVMLGRPFTGEAEAGFPFCAGDADAEEPPTTIGGCAPVAVNGVEVGFFVAPAAEAYDGAAVEEEFGAEDGFAWPAVEVIRDLWTRKPCILLVIAVWFEGVKRG